MLKWVMKNLFFKSTVKIRVLLWYSHCARKLNSIVYVFLLILTCTVFVWFSLIFGFYSGFYLQLCSCLYIFFISCFNDCFLLVVCFIYSKLLFSVYISHMSFYSYIYNYLWPDFYASWLHSKWLTSGSAVIINDLSVQYLHKTFRQFIFTNFYLWFYFSRRYIFIFIVYLAHKNSVTQILSYKLI